MRRAAVTIILLGAMTTGALAGDIARRDVIGFSADGRTFAFEEYGVQDGSGFPYSTITVIDTASDDWVAPSPVRVLVEGDMPPLHEARAEAMDGARDILAGRSLYPGDWPGEVLASNPVTELSADPHRVEVLPVAVLPPIARPVTFAIEEYARPGSGCFGGEQAVGFRLTVDAGEGRRILHEDGARVPSSRGCPTGYRIAEVLVHRAEPFGPVSAIAVLVAYTRVGFEGPDVRWLAVTAPRL